MQIEAGKYYRSPMGGKFGPMIDFGDGDFVQSYGDGFVWDQNGLGKEDAKGINLIAEWTDTPAEPKLWRDLTPAEKGALLLAHHHGKSIEAWLYDDRWMPIEPDWLEHNAYRVKPETKAETVTLYAGVYAGDWAASPAKMSPDTHRITFDLIDGKPDPSSIRMEEL